MSKVRRGKIPWGEPGSLWAEATPEVRAIINAGRKKLTEERRLMEGWFRMGFGASHLAHEIPENHVRGEWDE